MSSSTSAEIELKLLIPGLTAAQARQALQRSPALRRRQPQVTQLWNIYFDTPEQYLRSQRSALRLRQTTRKDPASRPDASGATPRTPWLQTFKTAGHSQGGLSQRGEWERAVRGKQLSLAALAGSPWAELDPDGTRFAALQPCFQTRCERTLWLVRRRSGAVMEVALDAGSVQAGALVQPMLELELELVQGSPEDLFELASELAETLPLLPFDTSKAQRGYALSDAATAGTPWPGSGSAPPSTPPCLPAAAALRARPLRLPRRLPPQVVAPQVLGEVLQQLTGNLALLGQLLCTEPWELRQTAQAPGTLPSQHPLPPPELVHQARVGWRRWRSLLQLLKPWLPHTQALGPVRASLDPLLDALAQCRNLDVAHTETLPHWASAYTHSALFAETAGPDSTVAAWQQEVKDAQHRLQMARQTAYATLAGCLQDPATGAGLLGLGRWLQGCGTATTSTGANLDTPPDWAEARLLRWQRRLQRWLKASRQPGSHPQQLHDARLLAKRLRYGSEALASLLPKKAQQWASDATGWQTRIGLQRDAHQAAQLLLEVGAAPALAAFLRGVAAATDITQSVSDPRR